MDNNKCKENQLVKDKDRFFSSIHKSFRTIDNEHMFENGYKFGCKAATAAMQAKCAELDKEKAMLREEIAILAHALIHANELSVCTAAPNGRYVDVLTAYEKFRVAASPSTWLAERLAEQQEADATKCDVEEFNGRGASACAKAIRNQQLADTRESREAAIDKHRTTYP